METKARKLSLRGKILINILVLFSILTAAYVAISYFEFKDYTVRDCVDYAKGLCSLIEDELDAEHIDDNIEQGFDYPGYTEIRSRLGKLCGTRIRTSFSFMYTRSGRTDATLCSTWTRMTYPPRRRVRLSSLIRAT